MATAYQVGERIYELSPRADAERREARDSVMGLRRLGMINSDQARAVFTEIDRQMFRRETMREFDPDRRVRVTCKDCAREHVMPASVDHYQCECTPHEDRSAHIGRVFLT